MSPRKTTTSVITDDVDEAVEIDLDDDDLEEAAEPKPTTAEYMKFEQVGQVYDVVVTEHSRDAGRGYGDRSCPEVKGKALKPILTFRLWGETPIPIWVPIGQELTLTGSQVRLARKLDRDSIVGHRLRVEFVGVIHDKGKSIKDFKVGISHLTLQLPPGWPAARDDENPPF
jgi:hypothetical protein